MDSLASAREGLVTSLIDKLAARSTAIIRYEQTSARVKSEEQRATSLKSRVDASENIVNVRKLSILNDIYDRDKHTATRRLVRFAMICILFTTIVMYLGIHRYISQFVAVLLCVVWWGTFATILIIAAKSDQMRDKLFWNRFVWRDPVDPNDGIVRNADSENRRNAG